MKKIFAFAIVFVLLAVSALAQLSISDVKLGSDTQARGKNTTSSVTITNIGTQTIQNLAVSFPGANSKYQLSSTLSGTSVAPSASVTLTVKGYVPLDFDAVNDEGKKTSFDIADVALAAKYANGTDASKNVNLFMQAENKLRFGKDTEIEYPEDTKDLDDGDDFKDIKRGDEIKLNLDIENTFDNDGQCDDPDDYGDCSIEDIEVQFEPGDSEFDEDSDDLSDIAADDTDSLTFTFNIPDDIDEDEYTFELMMTGTDENGALHGDYIEFTLDVEVPKDQVDILDYTLQPNTLSCNDRKTQLSVVLKNTGSNDQDEVSIFIDSSKLDIKNSIYNIELGEGDKVTKTFSLTVPDKLSPGTYYIQIISNVDSDEETDRQSATLTVGQCETPKPPTNNTTTPPTPPTSNTEVKVVEVPPTSGVIYGKPKTTSTDNSVWLIAALFAIALMLLLILVVVLLKK